MADLFDRLAFHPGELAAQRDAGLTELAERVRPIISDTIPRGANPFLARQRMLFLGARDHRERLWATTVLGPEGFLSAIDLHTVRVGASVVSTDPLADALRRGTDVGTLAIDLLNRRRLRINGRWRPVGRGGLIEVRQAFGNCPKYIQARVPHDGVPADVPPMATQGSELDLRGSLLISTADTFFIATAADSGADVSHRGGKPGFVSVVSATEIRWPDYTGNAMQMTAGNLKVNPRAGLLFPDWDNGTTLQLTGTAEVRRSEAGAAHRPATGWETVFRITDTVWTAQAFPSRWSEPEYSRFN